MYTYLWKAKSRDGTETAQRVTANSAQEARRIPEEKGFTDLQLLKDDVMAEVTSRSSSLQALSASDEVKILEKAASRSSTFF